MYGALLEEAALAARLSALPDEAGDAAHGTYLQERAARRGGEAEQVSAWMRATAGLVDAEPWLDPVAHAMPHAEAVASSVESPSRPRILWTRGGCSRRSRIPS